VLLPGWGKDYLISKRTNASYLKQASGLLKVFWAQNSVRDGYFIKRLKL